MRSNFTASSAMELISIRSVSMFSGDRIESSMPRVGMRWGGMGNRGSGNWPRHGFGQVLGMSGIRNLAGAGLGAKLILPGQGFTDSWREQRMAPAIQRRGPAGHSLGYRSEEHTSELQSLRHLVCRLLLEK